VGEPQPHEPDARRSDSEGRFQRSGRPSLRATREAVGPASIGAASAAATPMFGLRRVSVACEVPAAVSGISDEASDAAQASQFRRPLRACARGPEALGRFGP
jgi:hypothetical protein